MYRRVSVCCSILNESVKKAAHTFGGVAQLGEHLPCKQGVMGSNPIISTRPQCGHPIFDQLQRSRKTTREDGEDLYPTWAHSSAG